MLRNRGPMQFEPEAMPSGSPAGKADWNALLGSSDGQLLRFVDRHLGRSRREAGDLGDEDARLGHSKVCPQSIDVRPIFKEYEPERVLGVVVDRVQEAPGFGPRTADMGQTERQDLVKTVRSSLNTAGNDQHSRTIASSRPRPRISGDRGDSVIRGRGSFLREPIWSLLRHTHHDETGGREPDVDQSNWSAVRGNAPPHAAGKRHRSRSSYGASRSPICQACSSPYENDETAGLREGNPPPGSPLLPTVVAREHELFRNAAPLLHACPAERGANNPSIDLAARRHSPDLPRTQE